MKLDTIIAFFNFVAYVVFEVIGLIRSRHKK